MLTISNYFTTSKCTVSNKEYFFTTLNCKLLLKILYTIKYVTILLSWKVTISIKFIFVSRDGVREWRWGEGVEMGMGVTE